MRELLMSIGTVVTLLGFILGYSYVSSLSKKYKINIEDVTPLHKVQPIMECWSPFDVYRTAAYEVTDDNVTLITSYGRVYNLSECKLIKDK